MFDVTRPRAGAGGGTFWNVSADGWIRLACVWPDNAVIEPRTDVHIYPGAFNEITGWSRSSYQPAAAGLADGRRVAVPAQALRGA